jgi:hypothetical protein
MGVMTNRDAIRQYLNNTGQMLADGIPTAIRGDIQPVIDMSADLHLRVNDVRTGLLTNSTSGTVFTTDANRDYFMHGFVLSWTKDATATNTNMAIRTTINATLVQLATLRVLSLTASRDDVVVFFPVPIKIDRSAAVSLISDTNVANFFIQCSIFGTVVDP